MKMAKTLILTPIFVFISNLSHAENKNDLRKFEIDKEHHFTTPTESHGSPTKEAVVIKTGTQESPSSASELGLKTLANKNEYILKLKLLCIDKQLPVSNIPSNKSIKWNLKLTNNKEVSGETLTDNQGIANLTLNSKESLKNKKIKVILKDFEESIDISTGPFEVLFPLAACKK